MAYQIFLTDDAVHDLEEIFDYISEHDAPEKATRVQQNIETVILDLSKMPNRGTCPKELRSLGMRDYREVFFKPYRVIYRVLGDAVYVYLIADGRRDMQMLLQRRLFGT